MSEQSPETRVGVYIDFDNIVISRYDQLHGDGAWRRDNVRSMTTAATAPNADEAGKLARARVDVSAIIDYASSFGTVAHSRAYADWSIPVNASYRQQLVERAVDLTQLFPTTRGLKNGADIRLAVDVMEDLFRLPDLTHIVIVAGDSDYIPLAQRAKRLGRFVVGIGVAGKTSVALANACDRFQMYDAIPGTAPDEDEPEAAPVAPPTSRRKGARATQPVEDVGDAPAEAAASQPGGDAAPASDDSSGDTAPHAAMTDKAATRLLMRALELVHEKNDDDEWVHAAAVKTQMKRMNPAFSERTIGHKTFGDFIRSRNSVVESKAEGQSRLLRLR